MRTSVALLLFLVASETPFSLSKDQDGSALGNAINQFGLDFYRKLASKDDGNLLVSPLGMSIILGMLHYGSRGKTADEMRTVLGYEKAGLTDSEVHSMFENLIETIRKDSEADQYLLKVDNAVFTHKGYPVLTEYKDGLLRYYNSNALEFDFQNERHKAVEFLNYCVKRDTNNQIEKSVDDVDSSTVMMLLNDMYFNGIWKTEFDPKHTTEAVFYNKGLKSKQTKVEMMNLEEELHFLRFGEGCLLELPYKGEDMAMMVYLPDALNGLYKAEQKLRFNDALADLKHAEKTKVYLSIPKFKLIYNRTLNTEFRKLGMKEVYKNSANLTGISEAGPIRVSKVMQKAAIEINTIGCEASEFSGEVTVTRMKDKGNKIGHEVAIEGSEASRVTRMVTETRIGGEIKIKFNHPFLVLISNKDHDVVLSFGRVSQL